MTTDHWLTAVVCVVGLLVGHTAIWVGLLNNLYGRPLLKPLLRAFRRFVGLIVAAPVAAAVAFPEQFFQLVQLSSGTKVSPVSSPAAFAAVLYMMTCYGFGLFVLYATITRLQSTLWRAEAVITERTETVDYWRELGPAVVGDGKHRHVARLPLNDVFRVDFTDLTLAVPGLPAAWDGLSILLLSDVHFCGTPSRAFFERVIDKLAAAPPPDLVVLAGDYLDTERHYDWIAPLLGRLRGAEGQYAILGNHDQEHSPERVRRELAAGGYEVLGNGWREVSVRGERCVLVGHEGPWFRPGPDLRDAPPGVFRLCVSHTPDNFYWGRRNGVGLMLCGHVHGGQIRVPVVGSIFVPSVYGRRFDMGVFEADDLVMAVGRGLSGKEPLRFRCRPQVLRLTLRGRPPTSGSRPRPVWPTR